MLLVKEIDENKNPSTRSFSPPHQSTYIPISQQILCVDCGRIIISSLQTKHAVSMKTNCNFKKLCRVIHSSHFFDQCIVQIEHIYGFSFFKSSWHITSLDAKLIFNSCSSGISVYHLST